MKWRLKIVCVSVPIFLLFAVLKVEASEDVITYGNIIFAKKEWETNDFRIVETKAEKVPQKATSVTKVLGLPGPILSETKIENGKIVCGHKNDKPKKSKKSNKTHIDGECCLDPKEIPNSRCYYPPEKYGKLIQKYLKSIGAT